jgi:two-component system, chemotaxis family, CheB/CheR fusion protein
VTASTGDEGDDPGLERLLAHILAERGFDFTGYKRASLARRVRRRMDTIGITDYDDYLDRLVVQPDEFTALFNTVLINVTSFFRDVEAWDYLRTEIVPGLLARGDRAPLRAWSAGCASGEEAYSLAMVLAEALGVDDFRDRVKIYATDVDEDALAQARQASYTADDLDAVPEELRERWFEAVGSRFVLHKDLRRAVIFGRNDLVQDAPISHVDVLMCRNTLMYLNAETQAQVLGRLHFALSPHGVLFLGKAEMLLSHAAHFRPVELKRRFFAKNLAAPMERRPLVVAPSSRAAPDSTDAAAPLHEAALMSGSTAQIVLDVAGRVVLTNHRAMHLFGLTRRDVGRPIQDLEVSYRPLELRSHLDEATAQRRAVWVRGVELVRGAADPLRLDVQVVPLTDETGTDLGTTVLFNDVTQYQALQDDLVRATRQLETASEELQSSNEELETTNEELQSTVEELETTNEELQSTNEELETMNEELQSMNDELQGSNSALRDHQEEVDRLNRFMGSVLGSMSSGVAVVDAELRVMAWNARAEDLWGLRNEEVVGEHLMNLDIGLPVERLRQVLRSQLTDAAAEPESVELEAVNRRGRRIDLRVTVTHVPRDGASPAAAMLVMDDSAGPEQQLDGHPQGRLESSEGA